MSWSFAGVSFERMDPDGQARAWPQSLTTSIDVVAGVTTGTRIVDVGAVQFEPWSFRAGFLVQADRDTFCSNVRYTSGTLITAAGASHTALCTKAVPLTHDGGPFYFADVTFEVLS